MVTALGVAAGLLVLTQPGLTFAAAAPVLVVPAVVHSPSPWLSGLDDGGAWPPELSRAPFASVSRAIGADAQRARTDEHGRPITGEGIGVALIDSGVVPVRGLDDPSQVVNGPDLSFESQSDELRHLDSFGHGTHLAGIIAARPDAPPADYAGDRARYSGIAPGSQIVSLKVAAADGATDVSQVIAAVDWVVAHHDDAGLNIRVINLSYGTQSLQSYDVDPLAHAVEQAWLAGIVVVVAAGNDGPDGTTLTNPAVDPYVIAVGASDHGGTSWLGDDVVADFSSVGDDTRRPDLLAPGRSIPGLRNPGSFVDERFPAAREGLDGAERLFRGSGTSQAAAVTTGAVALLLDERPDLTPDQVKYLLTANATPIDIDIDIDIEGADAGIGQLQLQGIHDLDVTQAPAQEAPRSRGTGSLELARGGSHVADPTTGQELTGELDIFGQPWDAQAWAEASATQHAWNGGTWNGTDWTGPDWDGSSWAAMTWRSIAWEQRSWTGITWRTDIWAGITWRGGWTGITWRDAVWAGITWREATWSSGWSDGEGAGRVG